MKIRFLLLVFLFLPSFVMAKRVVYTTTGYEAVGPFVSYNTTTSHHADGTTSISYGKPQWGEPILAGLVVGLAEAAVTGLVTRKPVADQLPRGFGPNADIVVTTGRDGKAFSSDMRKKINQRLLEGVRFKKPNQPPAPTPMPLPAPPAAGAPVEPDVGAAGL